MPFTTYTLTEAESDHVFTCLEARDQGQDAGWYYGDKQQFENRHKRLLEYFRSSDKSSEPHNTSKGEA